MFLVFVLLGVVLVVTALAYTLVIDEAGVERLWFGHSHRVVRGDLGRQGLPRGGLF